MRSSAYALRSYLYLLVHTLIAGPAALWLGAGPGMGPCPNKRSFHILNLYEVSQAVGLVLCQCGCANVLMSLHLLLR